MDHRPPLTPRDPGLVDSIRRASSSDPLRLLVSGCLHGRRCTWDETSPGDWPAAAAILALPAVRAIPVCPEELAFGTPRPLSDLHGGDGFDAWDGRARVLTEAGEDWTGPLLDAARAVVARAIEERVELALLLDMSAMCGSQVISDGARRVPDRRYRRGPGLLAAGLIRAGIPVVSQRDLATLERLWNRLDSSHPVDAAAIDHHESSWYRASFG